MSEVHHQLQNNIVQKLNIKIPKIDVHFLKKNYHWFLLAAIFLFAIWIRSFSFDSEYVNADDPYRGLRAVQYLVDNNFRLPTHDTLANYPTGLNFYQENFLWYLIPGVFGMVFKALALDNPALLAVKFYPILFGGLTVVASYFLSSVLFPKRRELGLLVAFFIAVAAPIIIRTTPPSAIKEPIAGVFLILTMIFFIQSIKLFNWKHSVLAGLFLTLMNYSWGGAAAVVIVYAVFALGMIFFNRFDKNFTHTYLITFFVYFLVGLGIEALVGGGPFPQFTSYQIMIHYPVIAIILLKFANDKFNFIKSSTFNLRFGTYMLLTFGAIFTVITLLYEPVGDQVFTQLSRLRAPLSTSGPVGTTIAYYRASTFEEVFAENSVGFARVLLPLPDSLLIVLSSFVLSLIGFAAISWKLAKREFPFRVALFLIVWYLIFFGLGIGAVRLIYLTAFPFAFMAAVGVYYSFIYVYNRFVKQHTSTINLNSLEAPKKLGILLAFAIPFVLVISIHAASGYGLGSSISPSMSSNWEEALVWLNNNSKPSDVVVSWWDYGYIIQYYAKRPTFVDPGHPDGRLDIEVAKFFMSTNESEYLGWLRSLDVQYVVHDASMVGKYGAVTTIGSDGKWVDQFMTFNYKDRTCLEAQGEQCVKQVIKYQSGDNSLWLVQTPQTSYPVIISGNRPLNVSTICTPTGSVVADPNGIPGCALFGSNGAVYMGLRCDGQGCAPRDLHKTNFARMWFLDAVGMEHFEKVYDNGEVKIFKVKY